MRRRPLLKGALMLMAAGAMTRALGTLYRILIVRWAGPEALGLFQMVLPLYRMASTMATLRLPVALTQVTADALARGRLDQVHRARRVTAALIMAMTGLTALTVVGAAPFLAGRYLTDPRTGLLILLLPLAFVPSALTGIFRGFAEGRQNMASTATGQVVEQLIRVPVVLLCLSWWGGRGVEYAAAALVVGLGAGEPAGLITAMIMSGWWRLPRPAASGGARA
ncbi:MAG: oligosaccharide flippase family protein, partial [Limnochordales bacterium]